MLKAGYLVTVWNRSQSGIDECVGYGAVTGASPKDVAKKSDIVITMVVGSDDVKNVVLGTNGVMEGARPGMVVIDMSTISPKVSKEVAKKLHEKGIKMLDAPVSGYDIGAKAGTLDYNGRRTGRCIPRMSPDFQHTWGKHHTYGNGEWYWSQHEAL